MPPTPPPHTSANEFAVPKQPGRARVVWLALAGILVIGLIPRLYSLHDRSLWFDEAFCWRLIQFPFFEMIERVGRDNHPPLYFILLQGWAALFGDSAVALRLLSVVFGLASIIGTYLFAIAAFQLDGCRNTSSMPRISRSGTALFAVNRPQPKGTAVAGQ